MNKKNTLNKYMKKYSPKEEKNISSKKISIVHNTEEIQEFVKQELREKSSNKKIYYGKVNDKVSSRILKKYKINIKEYNISLKGDNIRKIIKDHGDNEKENLRGQIAMILDDFNYIDDIINEPDFINLSHSTKDNKPGLIFIKKIVKEYTTIEYVSDKHKTLETQTMYVHKKKNSVTTGDINNPSQTSKTDSDTSS